MNPSRDKGTRFERELVEALRSAGLDALRVPLSGAQRGFNGDVVINTTTGRIIFECKVRRTGFKKFYEWLSDVKYLVFKQDRQEPLVAMRLATFLDLLTSDSPAQQACKKQPGTYPTNQETIDKTAQIISINAGKPSIAILPCDTE